MSTHLRCQKFIIPRPKVVKAVKITFGKHVLINYITKEKVWAHVDKKNLIDILKVSIYRKVTVKIHIMLSQLHCIIQVAKIHGTLTGTFVCQLAPTSLTSEDPTAEALTLGRGTRRCGTGRIIPRVDWPTQRGKGSLAKFLATMSTIMHLNLSILMEKRKIGGDIHFHLMSLSDRYIYKM